MIRHITNFLLIMLGVIIGLVLMELLFRFIPISSPVYRNSVWDHWLNPESPSLYNSRYSYSKDIGYERTDIEHQGNGTIILFLGDSVSENGDYIALLQKKITAIHPVSIINAGTVGYDTELEYRFLKHRGLEMNPDIIVLQFNINDFGGTPLIIKQGNGWLAYDRKGVTKHISPRLLEISHLYRFFAVHIMANSNKEIDVSTVNQPLEHIISLTKENNITLVILAVPPCSESDKYMERYLTFLNYIRELEFDTLDLAPAFSVYEAKDICLNIDHPNEKGHEIIAEELFEFLMPMLQSK